jgi:L-alanine-DL-glutamate epimerase-like enolase superfamily enzyme
MRITQFDSQLLRLPLKRPIFFGETGRRLEHVFLLVVHLDTDAGHRGLGFAYTLYGGGRAMKVAADDDLGPLVVGEDPLDHIRLGDKVSRRLQYVARHGLAAHAYSAIDLALWDLKGKVAGMPLYKLLGGARESAPVYGADTGWLWMTPEEIVEASRPYLDQGMMGVKIRVGSQTPEIDADRVTRIREALGEDIWLGIDANQRYDYATALSMGHFFEEEMGIDWFEEPISSQDIAGHARLAQRLEVPIAVGESLQDADEFHRYLQIEAADVLQPDITVLGGLTAWLQIAHLADLYHRPISPHLMPEVAAHLACGLSCVRAVEYMPWFGAAFTEGPAIQNGQIVPSRRPGLGLEIRPDCVEKYRVDISSRG